MLSGTASPHFVTGIRRAARKMKRTQRKRMRNRVARLRQRFARLKKQVRPETLYSYSFPTSSRDPVPTRSDCTLVHAGEDNLTELKAAYPRELSQRKFQILLERLKVPSEKCWLISDAQGNLCGYCHLAFESTLNARINHLVHVGREQAYFFDDYVFKKHRGKGLHAASVAMRMEIAAGMGITEGLTTISKANYPSIASYGKFGLRSELILVYIPKFKRTFRLSKR